MLEGVPHASFPNTTLSLINTQERELVRNRFSLLQAKWLFAAFREVQTQKTRTSPQQIGSIMALLAVFDDAQVLPPEGSSEAPQVVHALIQAQSAFLKSQNPAVRRFFSKALRSYFFDRADSVEAKFYTLGWTSEILEAVVLHTGYPNTWSDPQLQQGLQPFNVSRDDLYEIQVVFDQARQRFIRVNRDIHDVFRLKRREMPGG